MTDIFQIAAQSLRDLEKMDSRATQRLLIAYEAAWERLQGELEAMFAKMAEEVARTGEVPQGWLARTGRLQSMLNQVEEEIGKLTETATKTALAEQGKAAVAAQGNLARVARAAGVRWDRVPRGAMRQFVGLTANGSPLGPSFERLGRDMKIATPDGALAPREIFERVIARGLAQQANPNVIVRDLRRELDARQAQRLKDPAIVRRLKLAVHSSVLNSYRESAREGLKKNGIKKWRWISARQPGRTCPACYAMDGKIFEVEEPQRAHPNCRCRMVAVFDENEPADSGESNFSLVSEEQQKRTLGPAAFEAYRSGEIPLLEEFVKTYDGGKGYGPQYTAASLTEVLGRDRANFYFRGGKRTLTDVRETFEKAIADKPYEVAGVLDDDGRLILRKKGDASSAVFNRAEIDRIAGKVFTHNHPKATTFSEADVSFFAGNRLKEIRVVTAAARYSLKPPTTGWTDELALRVRTEWIEIDESIISNLRIEFRKGMISIDTFNRRVAAANDEILKELSRRMGLRYETTLR